MGTEDLLNELNKYPNKEFTSTEISQIVSLSHSVIRRILRCLVKDVSENVKYRELSFEEKKKKYGRAVNTRILVYWIE